VKDKIFSFLAKHPIWVILVCIAFVVVSASGVQNLSFKSDYQVFFGDDNPQLVAFEAMQKTYDKSDNVSFVVVPKSGKVFTQEHLTALQSLTKLSWQVPYSSRVDSLTNYQYSYANEDEMIVDDLVGDTESLTALELNKITCIGQ